MLDGSIDKYKGQIIAQGFSQVQGIHHNEIFTPTTRMAAMCTVIMMAATEDLELELVDTLMAFLNGDIDAEIYMKIPEGFEVDGEPQAGEDLKHWVVCLLKGLYCIIVNFIICEMNSEKHFNQTLFGFTN